MPDRVFLQPIVAQTVHIDTVKLSHVMHSSDLPPPKTLEELNFDISIKRRGDNRIHTAHSLPSGSRTNEPYITVILSENKSKYNGINVECSLAKLVDGIGLGNQTTEDIDCALDAVEDYIRMRINVEFNARTAKVARFDVNADFLVGEERVGLYEEVMSRPHSSLIPSTFGDSTKYYYNTERTFAVYGKKKEMEWQFKKKKVSQEDVLAAEGLLRIESRLTTPQAVRRFADKHSLENIAGQLITKPVASAFISEAITQLKLDRPKFSMEARSSMLIEQFRENAAEMLGILMYRALLGEDFWKELGWSRSTYYKKKQALESVNLWNISPAEALPALVVLPDADNNSTSIS